MNNQTVTNEGNGKVQEVFKAVGDIAEVGLDLGVLKKRIENAVDEAVVDAERLARRGKYAVEDAVEDTTHWIKKNPWQAVGYTAGASLGLGLLLGAVIARPRVAK